ncbi:porin [Acidovorax sp. NO-1]|uniref:porin n=1 Tax=Acidovorax sp. NO-1 TaxID=512030 RepID=UPI00023FC656|nr:porin [Acidovorax sp. NO-1]EHL22093.1 porin [Acidovorax sp. NO-1]
MKKSLIALAVLAASGAAMAQSSVTLYGVADAALVKSSGVSAQMGSASIMNNGTSRIGLRGVEDLGGGLTASFNFEQGVNLEDGALTGGAAGAWNRAAFVALSGGFGKFQMGRALNPSFFGIAAWELTGTANYSVVGTQFGYAAAGPRNNSMFMYNTPKMGGFSGSFGYVMKPDNGGNAKYDLNLIYANGPLATALSYNSVKNGNDGLALGASYDFGAFKIAGSLQDSDIAGTDADPKGFTLGATVPLGAFALTLDIARDTEFKDTDVLLEGKYALSKRTFAYAAYYKDGDKKLVTGAKNHFSVGVRHNF